MTTEGSTAAKPILPADVAIDFMGWLARVANQPTNNGFVPITDILMAIDELRRYECGPGLSDLAGPFPTAWGSYEPVAFYQLDIVLELMVPVYEFALDNQPPRWLRFLDYLAELLLQRVADDADPLRLTIILHRRHTRQCLGS